jgi:uncharacterized membrane protein YjgN (DUF898 family)
MQTDVANTVPMEIESKRANQRLNVKFTGSGSEYLRIWVVNLFLILVTLGIYYPWAKARKMRYFWENTLVDGDPLGFHGYGRQFFLGYVVTGLLFALYTAGDLISPLGTIVALMALAVLWPALLRASLCFRLRNTSWRGVRFEFKGTLAGAYRCVTPLWIPLVAFGVLGALNLQTMTEWQSVMVGMLGLASGMLYPLFFFWFKRYQHCGFCLADERTELSATGASFYLLSFKVLAVYLLMIALVLASIVAVARASGALSHGNFDPQAFLSVAVLVVPPIFIAGAVVASYLQARLQNLVWSNTNSAFIKFESQLNFVGLTLTRLKNWLLIGLTLGMYWPFAAVAIYRLRVEAVGAETSMDLSELVDRSEIKYVNAVGDVAGDFFGLDLGI